MSFKTEDPFKKIIPSDYLDSIGVDYRRTHGSSGPQLNVKTCPCCGSNQYKVFLNANSGLGNCFAGSCQEGFNLYKFIKAVNGYVTHSDVMDAAHKHIRDNRFMPKKKTRAATKQPPNILYLPESKAIPCDGKNLKYLIKRGISGKTASRYGLRFCKRGEFVYKDEEGRQCTQDYSDRIIIPIYDCENELASFQGRDITGNADKKYLFPPGFASTGGLLYNMPNAMGSNEIILNEGVFDVIATKLALPDVGVVGSFGCHLSKRDGDVDQFTQLKRLETGGMDRLTIMWDGSLMATKTAIRQGIELVKNGMSVRIALLPKDSDPNEISVQDVQDCFNSSMRLTRLTAPCIIKSAVEKYGRDR